MTTGAEGEPGCTLSTLLESAVVGAGVVVAFATAVGATGAGVVVALTDAGRSATFFTVFCVAATAAFVDFESPSARTWQSGETLVVTAQSSADNLALLV
jgi:hypothetical protein